MGLRCLLDTNVVLYHLAGRLAQPLEPADYYVSVISELELLSYPGLNPEMETHIQSFLGEVTVVQLTQDICKTTIELRRRNRIKLPDAIIAGTAKTLNATLVTNDENLFKLSGLTVTPATLHS
ncbi:MAG TPA: type II toxin-antitoxin system VapC family toxin [Candidatus Hydrogenedentes bacterium]|nr:type II toxin-antitoxin system VapC family toxin [Candidatus Hydrogenedentota bacterium]HRK36683.1 type II toxin-antitoxin system VapC family toxin [Candidatus Hydrogenedentota bacterium]